MVISSVKDLGQLGGRREGKGDTEQHSDLLNYQAVSHVGKNSLVA